ncbi:MAG: glycosyltransferase family 2 protein [Caldisphaeraceae archaeon]|nr:glycosyltransferase family 2 protein [Caldisphaeraceae archaeon]MEB3692380.1 glycosyltransferase family 2 protein [Caldisphaeraceae archaeon]MEB3798234.1 glycosyltransferase family 2 protein [Caldisphaeraceae archaeon]
MDANAGKVSIIIPTYNESKNIAHLIERIKSSLKECCTYEIIVVDDNSPDGTSEIVKEMSKVNGNIRLLVREEKRGLSSAVIDGIKISSGEYIVVMDADLQHPPEVIPKLVRKLIEDKVDIVVASRYKKGGGVERWSAIRKAMSRGASLIAKLLVPEANRTSDPMSGFFAFRKKSINIENVKPIGYKILLELLYSNPKAKVSDIAYIFGKRYAGSSKLGFKEMVTFLIHVIRDSRPIKFATVGASGTFVNLGMMYLFLRLGLFYDYASAIGIESSILSNFTFNNAWTFKDRRKRSLASRIFRYHVMVAPSGLTIFFVMEMLAKILNIYPLIGQFIGIIFGFVVNYLLSSKKVWNP